MESIEVGIAWRGVRRKGSWGTERVKTGRLTSKKNRGEASPSLL